MFILTMGQFYEALITKAQTARQRAKYLRRFTPDGNEQFMQTTVGYILCNLYVLKQSSNTQRICCDLHPFMGIAASKSLTINIGVRYS